MKRNALIKHLRRNGAVIPREKALPILFGVIHSLVIVRQFRDILKYQTDWLEKFVKLYQHGFQK